MSGWGPLSLGGGAEELRLGSEESSVSGSYLLLS